MYAESTFVNPAEPMPVELLRDGRGIYGIGVSDLFDFEAIAWSCGIKPEPHSFESAPRPLILRPDRLFDSSSPQGAVLQKITGGFRHGPFERTHEEQFRRFIHHAALNRAALPWPPPQDSPSGFAQWWSVDKKQQARNRSIYHGLRCLSLNVVNHLIGAALAAADADAVKAARRFTFASRESIYRACALSRRALQLTDTFPALAMAVYSYSDDGRFSPQVIDWNNWNYKAMRKDFAERKEFAARLVERGARLRDVADVMNIPMALRHIKPGAAHLAGDLLCRHPELLTYMPATTAKQHIWLKAVRWAFNTNDPEFAAWAAKHAAEMPGHRTQEVCSFISDLSDWARANGPGREFITRPFAPSMSLKTVTTLSADWHEAVAANLTGPDMTFPAPWYPAAKVGDYDILPIEDSASLYREGATMRHCVGTYADSVRNGGLQIYSVRRDEERLATVSLARCDRSAQLSELRGPCNAQPPKEITTAVRRWLKAQKPLPPLPVIDEVPFFLEAA
jgi:PcfJ-like protein